MKARALRIPKILAVALAAAGCENTAAPEYDGALSRDAELRTASRSAPDTPVVEASGRARPAEARPVDPLVALAAELGSTSPEAALQRKEHFRPLCDKNGYARVGGAAPAKSQQPEQPLDPAGFCSSIRYELTH